MSEEVKVEESPPAEILPAKSEDKLEIEKEEQVRVLSNFFPPTAELNKLECSSLEYFFRLV
jgi:hypothetical protein